MNERERARLRAADGIATQAEVWCGSKKDQAWLSKSCHRDSYVANDPHGTVWYYKKNKCRCERCRAAQSAYKKAQWAKKTPEQKADEYRKNTERRARRRAAQS